MVNDIHSQLNATRVARLIEPAGLDALVEIVRNARIAGAQISLCGGRHAMGGQQFGADAWLVDLRRHAAIQLVLRCLRVKGWLVYSASFCDVLTMEIVFSVTQEGDGGFVGECLSNDIFTQGNTWEELRANVKEAVAAYFFDLPRPSAIRLHLVRDEVLAVA